MVRELTMSGDRRQEAGNRRRKEKKEVSSVSCLLSPDFVSSVVHRRSRPDDRLGAIRPGGKSELRRAVRRVTPGRGNSKESGTENTPLTGVAGFTAGGKQARVKRCGKSAPRVWQQAWQAKPRTEQGQIGRRVRLATGDHRTARPRLPGRLLDPVSNDGARGMIVALSEPRRKAGRVEGDRIRLTAGCGGLYFLFRGNIGALCRFPRTPDPGPRTPDPGPRTSNRDPANREPRPPQTSRSRYC